MKIFFDTNFILDYFIRKEYKQISEELLAKALEKDYEFFISFLSLANFAYILRKYPIEERDFYLEKTTTIFDIIPNNYSQITEALKLKANDFEDAIQYQTALEKQCDFIITRNIKDFTFSTLPIYTPEEFVQRYLK